jgi:hypothetical protein
LLLRKNIWVKLSLLSFIAGIVMMTAVALAQVGTKEVCVDYATATVSNPVNGACATSTSSVRISFNARSVCIDQQNTFTVEQKYDASGNLLPCPAGTVSAAVPGVPLPPTGGGGGTGGPKTGPGSGEFDKCLDAGSILCLPDNPFSGAEGIAGSTSAQDLITRIIRTLLFLGGILAVVFIIVGGYLYITSRGNEAQAKKGAAALTYAIIGLILVILSYVLVNVVVNFLTT